MSLEVSIARRLFLSLQLTDNPELMILEVGVSIARRLFLSLQPTIKVNLDAPPILVSIARRLFLSLQRGSELTVPCGLTLSLNRPKALLIAATRSFPGPSPHYPKSLNRPKALLIAATEDWRLHQRPDGKVSIARRLFLSLQLRLPLTYLRGFTVSQSPEGSSYRCNCTFSITSRGH